MNEKRPYEYDAVLREAPDSGGTCAVLPGISGGSPGQAGGGRPTTREPDADTLMFFNEHPDALELYKTLEEILYKSFPVVNKRVQKTQITFFNRHVFACVSFARVKRKAELPKGYLVITLGLPAPLPSDRVAVKTEPYPGRWTHHFVLSRKEELDGELLSWIRLAYEFAESKRAPGRSV